MSRLRTVTVGSAVTAVLAVVTASAGSSASAAPGTVWLGTGPHLSVDWEPNLLQQSRSKALTQRVAQAETGGLPSNLGTGPGQSNRVTVTGSFAAAATPVTVLPAAAEDNGSLSLAAETGITKALRGVRTTGTIGDGPHGSAGTGSGDFDAYAFSGKAGDTVQIAVTTPQGALSSLVLLIDPHGFPVAYDLGHPDGDSSLIGRLAVDGRHTVFVGGCCAPGLIPGNLDDSASGPGVSTEGPYELLISLPRTDRDVYTVDLRRGDVLGVGLTGVTAAVSGVDIHDPLGRLVMGSGVNAGGAYPDSSPLPQNADVAADHIVSLPGRHTIVLTGLTGQYGAEFVAKRPGREARPAGSVQTLFLDFDGAVVDPSIFGGPPGDQVLAPLSTFLPRWGLTAADEARIVSVAIDTARYLLNRARLEGGNVRSGLRIVTSRDSADVWGQPDVSRVIIGGTAEQTQELSVAVAESVDPGNFDAEETALITLDRLSAPAGAVLSLNTYFGTASDRAHFIGRVVGTLVAHETAHYFGGWHTSNVDAQMNVMDQGGRNIPEFFGVGSDGFGGTADDVQNLLRPGPYSPLEGLRGTEDPAARVSWALALGAA